MSPSGVQGVFRICTRMFLAVLIFALAAKAACECGFRMHDTSQYFTHIIYSNFSQYDRSKKLAAHNEFKRNWVIQRWSMSSVSWRTPLPVQNWDENVYLEDGTMVLRQLGYPAEGILAGKNVSIASIAGQSDEIFHGSFRTEIKIEGAQGGSVGAFFWYHDDNNEIDIEILTREIKAHELLVHYTTHPAVDAAGGSIDNATAVMSIKGHEPGNWFQRHRFDWGKKELRFYHNGSLLHANDMKVPEVSGRALMNLWADGGLWSGAPSTTNVYMRVKYVVIYHNTTASDGGQDLEFNARCARAGGLSDETVCLDLNVEDGAVDPSSLAAVLTPLPFWVLSLLWLLLVVFFTCM
ncbi:hypothetical protein LOZ53_004312 [Ophidiomyces ophidiicola]|nr:hypothetical protein LOZ64_005651 [Ophidiomyces ophidiicola]KAI1914863.1 hypothetical protein LOZ61_002000 [Ophidiomyces ophidiicola]KAI1924809.1 hypothetical protein LOZ60_004541 [Ophidiomyces ophidiicola]KAI1957476.1 hypothetical protein LOZ59_003929 [Ophidiomyces ophidiicola]KAI1978521.1 hypothetical protein LOZ55_002648 [Ophidiomyces ophidiicola]